MDPEILAEEKPPGSLAPVIGAFGLLVGISHVALAGLALLGPERLIASEALGEAQQVFLQLLGAPLSAATQGPGETAGTLAMLAGGATLVAGGLSLLLRRGWGWQICLTYAGLMVLSQGLLIQAFPAWLLTALLSFPVTVLALVIWISPHQRVRVVVPRRSTEKVSGTPSR